MPGIGTAQRCLPSRLASGRVSSTERRERVVLAGYVDATGLMVMVKQEIATAQIPPLHPFEASSQISHIICGASFGSAV